jgi:hypothetical protein
MDCYGCQRGWPLNGVVHECYCGSTVICTQMTRLRNDEPILEFPVRTVSGIETLPQQVLPDRE